VATAIAVAAPAFAEWPAVEGEAGRRLLDALKKNKPNTDDLAEQLAWQARSEGERRQVARDLGALGYTELAAGLFDTTTAADDAQPLDFVRAQLDAGRTPLDELQKVPPALWVGELSKRAYGVAPVDGRTYAALAWAGSRSGAEGRAAKAALALERLKADDIAGAGALIDEAMKGRKIGDLGVEEVPLAVAYGQHSVRTQGPREALADANVVAALAERSASNADIVKGLRVLASAQRDTDPKAALQTLTRALDLTPRNVPEAAAIALEADEAWAATDRRAPPLRRPLDCEVEFSTVVLKSEAKRREWITRTLQTARALNAGARDEATANRALMEAHRTRGLSFELERSDWAALRLAIDRLTAQAEENWHDDKTPPQTRKLRREKIDREFDALRAQLRTWPATQGRAPFRCVDAREDLAKGLERDGALLEILEGEVSYEVLVLFRDATLKYFPLLDRTETVTTAVDRLRQEILAGPTESNKATLWEASARQLRGGGLDDVLSFLEAKKIQVVHVVAEGPWQGVPFEIFLDKAAPSMRFVYMTSSRVLLESTAAGDSQRFAVFLHPHEKIAAATPNPRRATRARADGLAKMKFPAIGHQHFDGQCKAIAAGYPSSLLELHRRSQASEEALLSVASPRVLHFGGHAVYATQRKPGDPAPDAAQALSESALALAGAGPDSPRCTSATHCSGEDGFATAYEISQMSLGGTDLVVLAGCQTAEGFNASGEGAYGLHRAFQIAGARTVVASLWPVDAAYTQALMVTFYGELAKGARPSAALAVARAQLKSKLPADWAPFVIYGTDHPVRWPQDVPLGVPPICEVKEGGER
jgi:CHAT domain-containing protein